ncbi:MAG: hypothetical protein SW019_25130 [Actinomycetota bacterium]|nr:hypothetical protein [Actinomycetota bacterium]
MADQVGAAPFTDDPFHETLATTGLFLIVTAIIASAVALGSWSLSELLIAVFAAAVALLSFACSILCFRAQAAEAAPAAAEITAAPA